jgi:hypothetical protein
MAEPAGTTGQAMSAAPLGTTATAPQTTEGQSASQGQTTVTGTDNGQESFFDPKSIEHSPELKSAYKQMQGKWTKELQRFKEAEKKVSQYDSILANPLAAVQAYAQQNGYQLVQRDPNAKAEDDTPKTWDDVYTRAKQEVLKSLQPILGEVKQLKQQSIEQYLDNNHSDWRQYEPQMLENLTAHPSLANDPDKLYRLSVPQEVLDSRAAKAALAKVKGASENAQMSGANGTTRQPTTTDRPPAGSPLSAFAEWAKAKVLRDGIKPLAG